MSKPNPVWGLGGTGEATSGSSTVTSTGDESSSTTDSNPVFRRRIDIDLSDIGTSVTDLPVRVRLDAGRIDFDAAGAQGERLAFVAADETSQLPHEIESWAPPAAEVWVRVPTIDVSTAFFYMEYGREPNASVDPATTWASAFAGVWHLGIDVEDSTTARNDATPNGTRSEPGPIAGGVAFDGQSWIDLPLGIGNSNEGAVEMWFRTAGTEKPGMLFYGASWPDGDGFGDGTEMHVDLSNTPGPEDQLGLHLPPQEMGATEVRIRSSAEYEDERWRHVVASWKSGEDAELWIDGVQDTTGGNLRRHDAPPFSFDAILRLGRPGLSDRYFTGEIDEVRLYRVQPTADWIIVDYRSQSDSLLTFQPEEEIEA